MWIPSFFSTICWKRLSFVKNHLLGGLISCDFLCTWSYCLWIKIIHSFWFVCLSFLTLFQLVRASSTYSVTVGDTWHSCLVPNFNVKPFCLSSLGMMLATGFHRYSLSFWGCFLLFIVCGEYLLWMGVEFYQRFLLYLLRCSYVFSPLLFNTYKC